MKEQDRENNFENRLRQKAEGFERKPSDDVWANVKISLQKNNRNRRFLWLWAAAIGLLIGAGTTGWYFMNHSSQKTVTEQTKVTFDSSDSNDSSFLQEKTTQAENSIADAEASGSSQQQATSKDDKEKVFSKNENQPINSSLINEVEESSGSLSTDEMEQLALNEASSPNGLTESLIANQEDLKPLKKELPDSALSLNVPGSDAIAETAQINSSAIPAGSNARRFSIAGEVIPLVSFLQYQSQGATTVFSSQDQAFADSITQVSQADSKPLIGFSAGVSTNYRISKRFSVGAGIHFTRTGTKNSFPEAGAIETLFDSTSFVSNPGTVNSNNTSWTPLTGFEGTTHYDWLDLSLQGEWIFLTDDKNELSWLAGMGVSHFMNYKIAIHDVGETTVRNTSFIKNNQEPPLFHVYNLTGKTGVNYRRIISDHLSLSAGLQFQYYLSSITLSSIPISEHPYWLGVSTGISYRF